MTKKLARVAPALFAVVVLAVGLRAFSSTSARLVPPPAVDTQPGVGTQEVAILAGGCFWGVQAVYQHLTGVTRAVSGYAGGQQRTAEYELVTTGRTGHAESVEIRFDPREISYGRLLQVFFSVAHDPTELNRQGPDVGPQYRSAIFPTTDEQAAIAKAYIAQLNQARAFNKPVVTTVEPGHAFYTAEPEHQDFLENNPRHPYIVINDLPKLDDLKRIFPERYRAKPVLVRGSREH